MIGPTPYFDKFLKRCRESCYKFYVPYDSFATDTEALGLSLEHSTLDFPYSAAKKGREGCPSRPRQSTSLCVVNCDEVALCYASVGNEDSSCLVRWRVSDGNGERLRREARSNELGCRNARVS